MDPLRIPGRVGGARPASLEKRKCGASRRDRRTEGSSCATPSPGWIRLAPHVAACPQPPPQSNHPRAQRPSRISLGLSFSIRSAAAAAAAAAAAEKPAGMKAPFAILLAACLCVDGVFSLVCWSCDNVESNWSCWRMQICSNEDSYCATTYSGAGIGGYSTQSISKGCVPICPRVGVDIGIAAMSVHCCSSFLCNINGANSIQINHLVLALATLTSFFYLFGSRL